MVLGANHNYFNTEWTPGLAAAPAEDDWGWGGSADDPNCGWGQPGRLTAEQQQAVGATYIAALVRLAVDARRRRRPPCSTAPGCGPPRSAAAKVLTHALGGRRHLVYKPRLRDLLVTSGPLRPGLPRLHLGRRLGRAVRLRRRLHGAAAALAAHDGRRRRPQPPGPRPAVVAHRAARCASASSGPRTCRRRRRSTCASPSTPPPRGGTGAAARRCTAGPWSSCPRPTGWAPCPAHRARWARSGRRRCASTSAGARAGIDLTAITGIELVSLTGRGRAWLLDIHTRRPGAPASAPIPLPQVERGELRGRRGRPGQPHRVPAAGHPRRGGAPRRPVGHRGHPRRGVLRLPPGPRPRAPPRRPSRSRSRATTSSTPWTRQYVVVIKALSEVTTGRVRRDRSPSWTTSRRRP